MRSREDFELVDVELVDDDAAPDGRGDRDAPVWAPVVRRPAWLRRPPPAPAWVWPWTARTAAAALVAGVAVTGASGAAGVARLQGLEGLSASLAEPLVEVWSAASAGPMAVVGDLVVTYGVDGRGVTALDLATGNQVWTAPPAVTADEFVWCHVSTDGSQDLQASVLTLDDPADGAVVCASGTAMVDPGLLEDPSGTVVVLDLATGEVRSRLEVATSITQAEVHDGDLVVYGVEAEGRAVVGRWSLAGEQVWLYRSEPGMARDGYLSSYGASDGVLTIQGSGADVVGVDLATGEVVEPPSREDIDWSGWPTAELADGSHARVVPAVDGTASTVVVGPDGEERFTLESAYPMASVVDDGSAPGLLLVAELPSGAVRAVDAASGETAWDATGLTWGPTAVLGGVVLVQTLNGGTKALDARDGGVLWESVAPSQQYGWYGGGIVTDGRRVLLTEANADAADRPSVPPVLTARDVDSGQVLWRGPTGSGTGWMASLPGGALLWADGTELRLLRAPAR